MNNYASIAIGLATFGLTLGYALISAWFGILICVGSGLLWLFGLHRNWKGITSVGLIWFVSLATLGVWWNLPVTLMFFSIVTTLVAWDLIDFSEQLQQATNVDKKPEIKQAHLRRLSIVAGLGLLSGGIALSIRVELNLGWAIFLGILAIFGLSQVVGFIRQDNH